jgi:hypothetical protein
MEFQHERLAVKGKQTFNVAQALIGFCGNGNGGCIVTPARIDLSGNLPKASQDANHLGNYAHTP